MAFVDTLTIDYKKTLSDYRQKMLADARRKAVSTSFHHLSSARTPIPEYNLSLEECLKGDPFQYVHHQKSKQRLKNTEAIKQQLSGAVSHREQEKFKMIRKAEEAFDKADFVSVLAKDPMHEAYLSK